MPIENSSLRGRSSDEFTALRLNNATTFSLFGTMEKAGVLGVVLLRSALVIGLVWSGSLRCATYQADGTLVGPFGSHLLGIPIILLGLTIAAHWPFPQIAAIGSSLLIVVSLVGLSLGLILRSIAPGASGTFSHIPGADRNLVAQLTMFGAAALTMADSAKAYLRSASRRRSSAD
jgi:uncharacterized membrane protein YkgB